MAFKKEALAYAWRGSGKRWDAAPLQIIGGAIGGFVIWYWGLKVPSEILDNPAFSGLAAIVIGAICGALVAFVLRLCWYPVYRRYEPYGGLVPYLRAKLGAHMWPLILMFSGLAAFIVLFGGGAIWFVAQGTSHMAQANSSSGIVGYEIEHQLKGIDQIRRILLTTIPSLSNAGRNLSANNLQQSWRFDWEPPKAVLRDVWTIVWILGC